MNSISAPSLQAYQAWADPVRTSQRQVQPSVPDPAGRRGQPVVIQLSPQAEQLTAQFAATSVPGAANPAALEAAARYMDMDGAGSGTGRREAPFAHREEAPVYQPPGRLVDRSI